MGKNKGAWLNLLLSQARNAEKELDIFSNLWEKKKTYIRDTFEVLKESIKEPDQGFDDNIGLENHS